MIDRLVPLNPDNHEHAQVIAMLESEGIDPHLVLLLHEADLHTVLRNHAATLTNPDATEGSHDRLDRLEQLAAATHVHQRLLRILVAQLAVLLVVLLGSPILLAVWFANAAI